MVTNFITPWHGATFGIYSLFQPNMTAKNNAKNRLTKTAITAIFANYKNINYFHSSSPYLSLSQKDEM